MLLTILHVKFDYPRVVEPESFGLNKMVKVIVALTFDPLSTKSIGGHRLMLTNLPMKFEDPLVIERKPFGQVIHVEGHCDVDL